MVRATCELSFYSTVGMRVPAASFPLTSVFFF